MDFLGAVLAWFGDPDNWTGPGGIPNRMWEHIQLTAITVVAACLLAIPIALWMGHTRRGGFIAVSIVNIGRAMPSFGILALALPFTIALANRFDFISSGLGFLPTFVALFLLAIPPIFTNTYTAVREVDRGLVEAARGMGLSERQILGGIELPVASPLILASVRVATVQVIATATLAALVAWGGLGRYIIDGFAQQDNVEVVAGAVLVALLAVVAELSFGLAERIVLPKGVRHTADTEVAGARGGA
jgi:osmoprotectant transport system permease protein